MTLLMSLANYINIKAGLMDYFRPYDATILPTKTTITRLTNYKGMWNVFADLEIMISARRLERDNVGLELGNVEREVMKLVCQYKPEDIVGIKEMQYGGYERIYTPGNWAKSNWLSKTFIRIRFYHTGDILP
jgi:hypothetical protein